MVGYSGTPLPQKLGIKPGARVAIVDAPRAFALSLPEGVALLDARDGGLDVLLWFLRERSTLDGELAAMSARLKPAGALWTAWPKKASGVPTDLTENVVREVALPTGLVDNKVCAIDETWSGLRLVWRVELRPKAPR